MAIFFVKFYVIPNQHCAESVLGAYAHCWIVEETKVAAYNKAQFYISKDEWKIVNTEIFPIEVTEVDFEKREIGLVQYRKAQEIGIALVYVGLARDGKPAVDLASLKPSQKFDLNAYIDKQKRLAHKGRCLHFDGGIRCGEIISAHSIQKSGQLSVIADNGLVYSVSKNIGTLKKNNGRAVLEKQGIGKVSTFFGFCDEHDNQLFAPIDKSHLLPTEEQVLLYAYRSICRELFVKENALDLFNSQLAELPASSMRRKFFEDLKTGTFFGLSNLRRHKTVFDASLSNGRYEEIEYALFASKQNQFLAFSGLLYPDFDFHAQPLQNLADHDSLLDLLTICSAPMADGWGFLFAWHKTSSKTCTEFMRSLATVTYDHVFGGADAMFRMVVSSCENLAFSPTWWESLPDEHRAVITARLSHGANIFAPIDPEYLVRGLEGVTRWEFDSVYSKLK